MTRARTYQTMASNSCIETPTSNLQMRIEDKEKEKFRAIHVSLNLDLKVWRLPIQVHLLSTMLLSPDGLGSACSAMQHIT